MGLFGIVKKVENPKASYRNTGLETNISNNGWYKCVHCGRSFRKDSIEIDHIVPQSRGGGNNAENLQCLCKRCNCSKGNDMTQTKEDLRKRRGSYGQYKREQVLKPMVQEKRKEIREKYIEKLNDKELMEELQDKKFVDAWTDLRREARKRKLI